MIDERILHWLYKTKILGKSAARLKYEEAAAMHDRMEALRNGGNFLSEEGIAIEKIKLDQKLEPAKALNQLIREIKSRRDPENVDQLEEVAGRLQKALCGDPQA
jgi:hypothetical protein